MHHFPLHLKLIPLAVAALVGGLQTASFASPIVRGTLPNGQITLDASFSLPKSAAPSDAIPLGTTSGSSTGADFYLFQPSTPNNVFFHTYGFADNPTYFGARASGEGSFFATTRATYSRTFTNNSLMDQIYNFAFNVSDGQLGITGAGAGFAQLMLSVKKTTTSGTTTLAQDFTTLNQTAAGTRTCASNDIGALGGYLTCSGTNDIFGNNGPYNVNLGLVGANQSFTLDYDIIATVSGDLSAASGYGGYGSEMIFNGCGNNVETAQTAAVRDDGGCAAPSRFPGMAIARSGDPFNGPSGGTGGPSDRTTANFLVTSAPAALPEPGSLALLGLALAGLAATRRKNKADRA